MQRSPTVKYRKITYAHPDGHPLHLDIIRPESSECCPVLLMAHGGGWCLGERTGEEALAVRLAAVGYVVANLDYRLAPLHPFPAAFDDLRAAAEWVALHGADYGGDAERLGAYGSSAGGHLVALLATASPTPLRCAVSWGGPMDLRCDYGVAHNIRGCTLAFLGACLHDAPDSYTAASPRAHLTAQAPPLLLVQGSDDDMVPAEQTTLMLESARALGAPVEVLIIEGAGHAPGSPREANMAMAWQRVTDFFAQHL